MSEVAMQTIDQLILVAVAGVKPVLSTAAQQRLLAFAQSNPQFGPVIVKYAPAFWSMADSEITGWIDRLAGGDTDGAYGLICQATDYRLMVTALDAPRLMMPVGPVRAVTVITSPSASVVQSWKVRGEALYGKTGEMGTVDFLAGWPAGQLPHLIRLSLALIVRHWLQKPGDLALGELGEVAATVGQYVSLFVPRERVVRGREPWQL